MFYNVYTKQGICLTWQEHGLLQDKGVVNPTDGDMQLFGKKVLNIPWIPGAVNNDHVKILIFPDFVDNFPDLSPILSELDNTTLWNHSFSWFVSAPLQSKNRPSILTTFYKSEDLSNLVLSHRFLIEIIRRRCKMLPLHLRVIKSKQR